MSMPEMLPNLKSLTARLKARRGASPAVARPGRPSAGPASVGGLNPLRPRVDIPVRDPAPEAEALAKHLERGRFLARQEAWDEIAAEIAAADSDRALTPGLSPVARAIAEGARADVTAEARKAAMRAEPGTVEALLTDLETSMDDAVACPSIAFVLAMAHVDMALCWRGASLPTSLSNQRRIAYDGHMRRATALADRFDPFEHDSALWAAARCAVLESQPHPFLRVADDFEDLIDLDPACPDHMMALGHEMRPARFGSWTALDRQARRTVARTRDLWGVGAYAWVHIGAMEVDPAASCRLDAELFVEGLHDILHRHPTQHMANRLAAFTGLTMGGPAEPGSARSRIAECLGWIAQDHLRELHPAVWAAAPLPGQDTRPEIEDPDMLRRGRSRAMSSLAAFYAPALEAGRRLVFTSEGMQLVRGA